MKVLIIGASGLVGSNIYTIFKQEIVNDINIVGTHLNYPTEFTIHLDPLKDISVEIIDIDWDVIIHTGALTNVDQCETEESLSYTLTVTSTELLLLLAKKSDAKFVYISTDYVFDGSNGPYTETDAVNPINIYGKHKLEAEKLVSAYQNHLILRITNVYGDELRNKNFVSRTISFLKQQETIMVNAPSDQFATPINAADVAKAILLLIKDNKKGIYHLAGTDYLSRIQLLQRINLYYLNKIKINSVKTASLKQAAVRPLKGGLIAAKFISEYPEFIFTNTDDYLKQQS